MPLLFFVAENIERVGKMGYNGRERKSRWGAAAQKGEKYEVS